MPATTTTGTINHMVRAAAGRQQLGRRKLLCEVAVRHIQPHVWAIVDGEEDDTKQMLCTAHAAAPKKNKGYVANESGVVKAVVTHSFDTKCAYVIPDDSVELDTHVVGRRL